MAEPNEATNPVLEQPEHPVAPNPIPSVPTNGADETPAQPHRPGTWHAAAGRKGAERIRQLIQEGRLYEKEHGLKSGRQRIRQLIEEGKLYERDHGLSAGRTSSRRPARVSSQQSLLLFLHSFHRLAKP